MSSTQENNVPKSKRAKREELFKREQAKMLQGYNSNSFQPVKQSKRKQEYRQNNLKPPAAVDHDAGRNNSNLANTQKIGLQDKSMTQQQEFANILDQMSLNSSTTNPMKDQQNKENKINFKGTPIISNMNKSRSGLISSSQKGDPIQTKISEEPLTINSNFGEDGVQKNVVDPQHIHMEMQKQTKQDENQRQFELNRQQFELEDPYAQSQKINRADFARGSSKSRSRGSSRERHHRPHRSNKVSSFEKYEEIRFACYELQQKIGSLTQMVSGVANQLSDQSNSAINMRNQTIEVPIQLIEQMNAFTQDINCDFGTVQDQWSDYFGEQQLSSQRQRSKNRQIKKKLKGLENQNQHNSMIFMRDQKEFEQSLQHITKAHDANQDQMEQYLDKIETQVGQLKNTRDDLNYRYEGQLDAAVKQMVNFYENLETADPADIDSDNMSIEQVFFIKPTHQISQTIQQRGKSQLKISPRVLSSVSQEAGRARSQNHNPTGPKIPKLPFDKLEQRWIPEQPMIIQEKQTQQQANKNKKIDQFTNKETAVKSARNQNAQIQQNSEQKKEIKEKQISVCKQELKPVKVNNEQIEHSSRSKVQQNNNGNQEDAEAKELENNYENGVDYVMNPVMVGAMQLDNGFDNQYEDDYDGANITIDMTTERLQQFPESYEAINAVEDPNERIILKQLLFMRHERILKKQAKQERKRKKKLKKMQEEEAATASVKKEQAQESDQKSKQASAEKTKVKTFIPTPTNKSTYSNFGKLQNPALAASRSRGSLQHPQLSSSSSYSRRKPKQKNEEGLGMNERPAEAIDNTQIATSRFSLQSELPSLDTVDVLSAQRLFRAHAQDVNRTELLDCEEDLAHGLKTATQTSLVRQYEEEFRQKDIMRDQHKGDEKKMNYSSTNQSKISLIGKQISQGTKNQQEYLSKNYASNNTNSNQPIYIEDSEQCSINSDLKDINKASNKNLQGQQKILDLSGVPPQQFSVKSKKSTQQPSGNNVSNIDHSMVISQDPHSQEKGDRLDNIDVGLDQDNSNSFAYPPEMRQNQSDDKPVDASLASGASQYQRYLECEDGSPSIHIKNSYVQSDQSPSQLQINDSIPNDHFYQMQEQDEHQNQEYLDRRISLKDNIRQRLPLDVIQERQSEFSQSMMTNAARINTNRSKQSRQSKNHGVSQYQNMNGGASFHHQPNGPSALASVRSEINNQSSANRKDSSQGITQESFANDTGKMNQNKTEIEDYRYLVRSSSQAHTHRGGGDSSLNQSGNRIYQHATIGDQQVCIDGSLIQSRNTHKKNSNSSREMNDRDRNYIKLQRQPSDGKIDNQNRQKYFQNFEQDLNNMVIPNIKGKSRAQVQKNKSQGSKNDINNQGQVPPLSQGKSNNPDKKDSRNNEIFKVKNSQKCNDYAANSFQNILPNSEQDCQNQNYQPHSYRSHNIQGGESMRDRSYFDESPALFDQNCVNVNAIETQKATDMVKETITIIGSLSSQQVEDSIKAQIQSLKSGQRNIEEEIIDFSQQKLDSSIHTHLLQMQSIPSFPLTSAHTTQRDRHSKDSKRHSSSNDRQSKNSRVNQQHLAGSKGLKPESDLAESLTRQNLNLENTFEDDQVMLEDSRGLKPENEKNELNESQRKPYMLIRSSSECQLRDKEFYEMCADEDEIAMYCKLAEQNIFDAIHARNLSQSNIKETANTQISESPAQLFTQNMLNANKSSSICNNQLVFMSQQTYKKICGHYMKTQEKTEIGHQIGQLASATSGVVDQNSSQQQTRGKGMFKRFLNDPSRLLMSINGNGQGNPQVMNNYLGLNFLASSLDDGTLSNNIMMPTHKYNRRTLLMMQNLHNNYLYNNQSGILFTMQRGWNSGQTAAGGVNDGFQNLTGLNAAAGMTAEKGPSQNDGALKSLGGDPVNIASLLMGAKQQTLDPLNAGSITIVDDDGKHMIDRKLLMEANNSESQQTNARRLLSQSRNINGQVTVASDFSSLQTKQLGILRNTYATTQKNGTNIQRKISDSGNDSTNSIPQQIYERDVGSSRHLSCYGGQVEDSNKQQKDSGRERQSSDSMRQSKCSSNDDKSTEPMRKQIKTLNTQDNKNKIKNLLVGLKQIQQKNPNITQRSGSDLSYDKQKSSQDKLVSTYKTNVIQLQKKKLNGNGNYKTITTVESNYNNKRPSDYEPNGNFQTQKSPITRSNSSKSKIQNHLKKIIMNQQLQKNQMELSSSIASKHFQVQEQEGVITHENSATQIALVKSKSMPKGAPQSANKIFQLPNQPQSIPGQTPSNSSQMMNNVTNMLKKDKVKLLIGGEVQKAEESSQVIQNQTVQNFNSINGPSRMHNVNNPAIILKKQISEVRVATEPNSSAGANRKVTMRTNRVNSTSMGQAQAGMIKKTLGGGMSSARNSSSSKQQTEEKQTLISNRKPVNIKKKVLASSSLSQNLRQFKNAMLK